MKTRDRKAASRRLNRLMMTGSVAHYFKRGYFDGEGKFRLETREEFHARIKDYHEKIKKRSRILNVMRNMPK